MRAVLLLMFVTGCFSPALEATACGGGGACPPGFTCTPLGLCAVCGDGAATNGEECDDGNTAEDDDCTSACRQNMCGDQFVNRTGTMVEGCDEGGVDTPTCDADCTAV